MTCCISFTSALWLRLATILCCLWDVHLPVIRELAVYYPVQNTSLWTSHGHPLPLAERDFQRS
jgi:hypothetical protein